MVYLRFLLTVILCIELVSPAYAAPPAWWSESETQILSGSPQNNYAPANLGQLKHVATQAKKYLDDKLSLVGGAGYEIEELIESFEPRAGGSYTPTQLAALKQANYAPLNLGQLKAVTKPFYDRLLEVGYNTRQHLISKGYPSVAGGAPADWPHSYPWNPTDPANQSGSGDKTANYATANLGQLKLTFSFDLTAYSDFLANDNDNDGLPDWWETRIGSTNANISIADIGSPNYHDTQPTVDTPTGITAHPGNEIADPDTIFTPNLADREAAQPPGVGVALDFNVDWEHDPHTVREPNKVRVSIYRRPEDIGRTINYRLYRRKQEPGDEQPGGWTHLETIEPNDAVVDGEFVETLKYNVLYWYRVIAKTDFGDAAPVDVAYALPLVITLEGTYRWASGDTAITGSGGGYAVYLANSTIPVEGSLVSGISRTALIGKVLDRLPDCPPYDFESGYFTTEGVGKSGVNFEIWKAGGAGILVDYDELGGTADSDSASSVTVYSEEGTIRLFDALGDPIVTRLFKVPDKELFSTQEFPTIPLESIETTSMGSDFEIIPKYAEGDSILFGVTNDDPSTDPDETTFHGGNATYPLIAGPHLLVPFSGGTSALPPAFKADIGTTVSNKIPDGATEPVGIPVDLVIYHAGLESSTKFDQKFFFDDEKFKLIGDRTGATGTEITNGQTLSGDDNWQNFRLIPRVGTPLGGGYSLTAEVTKSGVQIGTDSVSVTVTDGYERGVNPAYTMPLDEGSGSRYRKISLTGRPLGDGKPQTQEESDQADEETFFDALTLGLRHSTTDVYLPVPGADLSVTVRRNTTPEIWTTRHGLRPHERPDRPFGFGWTTNLAANLEVINEAGSPLFVHVTDTDGASHQFVAIYKNPRVAPVKGLDQFDYVPVPTGKHEKSGYLESLVCEVVNSEYRWTFQSAHGTRILYEHAETNELTGETALMRVIGADREKGSIATSTHYYYRVKSVEGRLGNRLSYEFDGNPSLVPVSITAVDATGINTTASVKIRQDVNGRITDVWDAAGRTQYQYTQKPYTSSLTLRPYLEWALSKVIRPDGGEINYQMEFVSDLDITTPLADGDVRNTYWHANLGGITDPKGNATTFTYEFDRSRCNYHSVAGYYVQPSRPRWVKGVSFPGGSSSFKNAPNENWRLALSYALPNSYSVIQLQFNPGTQTYSVIQNQPGGSLRTSTVTDAEGATIIYGFGNSTVFSLNSLDQFLTDIRAVPKIACYQSMKITYDGVGYEQFDFDLNAGMALQSARDLSGNTTTYAYSDQWVLPQNSPYRRVFSIVGFNGYFPEPITQTNAMAGQLDPETNNPIPAVKQFAYETQSFEQGFYRVMKSITDESGRITTYGIDGSGRRTLETISGTGGGSRLTTFHYDDPKFPGVITKRVVRKDPNNVNAAGSLVTQYVLNSSGYVEQEIVDPGQGKLNLTTVHTYDGNGNRRSTKDPLNNITTFSYDACNRLIKVEYPGQYTKHFTYDKAGNKTKEIDENGNATINTYDQRNRLIETKRAGKSTSYRYNNVDSRISVTDANGYLTKTVYDALQRPIRIIDPVNKEAKPTKYAYETNSGGLTFDTSGFKPTTVEDPRGVVTNYVYDKLNRQTKKTVEYKPGSFAVWKTFYDPAGNPVKEFDPRLLVTRKEYDALNRQTKTIFESAAQPNAPPPYVEQFYNSLGQPWRVRDEGGNETDTEFDDAGRAVKVTSPLVPNEIENGPDEQAVTRTTYDRAGNVETVTDPMEKTTTFFYDVRNRKVKEVRPLVTDGLSGTPKSPTTLYAYDRVGNLIATIDPKGNRTFNGYDEWNRLVVTQRPSPGGWSQTEYDKVGNIVKITDPNGHVTKNTYDELNRLLTTTDAENITVINDYDEVGNRTSIKDGLNQETKFEYDGLNRNTKIIYPSTPAIIFEYDGLNKVKRTDSTARVTNYTYDNRNRLETVTYVNRPIDNRTYTYDDVGNLESVSEPGKAGKADVGYTYDALKRVKTEISGGTTFSYRYDLAGNRTRVSYPGSANRVLISEYDSLNRLATLTEGTNLTSYAYDLNGNVVRKTLPNGDRVSTSYDGMNRAEVIEGRSASALNLPHGVLHYRYELEHDAVGNLISSDETYGGTLAPRNLTLYYDKVDRLEKEIVAQGVNPQVTTTTEYEYDAAHNRVEKSVKVDQAAPEVTTFGYNNRNQLTSASGALNRTFGYDLNGNRTSFEAPDDEGSYSYDYENRMVSCWKLSLDDATFRYTYDYRARRVERDETEYYGNVTSMKFSGGTTAIETHIVQYPQGDVEEVLAEYIRGSDWGGGVGGVLYSLRNNTPSFTHYDGRGDVTSKTNGAGGITWQATYEAFGKRTQEQGQTLDRQKANTKDEDPTGLLNEGFRYRDLETGTFITRDPAGFIDGPNLYAYVRQNPWSKFDPEGLFMFGLFDSAGDYFHEMGQVWKGYGDVTVGAAVATVQAVRELPSNTMGVIKDVRELSQMDGSAVLGGVKGGSAEIAQGTKQVVSDYGDRLASGDNRAWGQVVGTALTLGGAKGAQFAKAAEVAEVAEASQAGTSAARTAQTTAELVEKSGFCFPAGTLVATPDGKVPIEMIDEGDEVLAYSFEQQKVVPRKVLKTHLHYTYCWVDVQAGREKISATRGHLFWVENAHQWVAALDLQPGMTVWLADGRSVAISGVSVRELDQPEKTFNFEVDVDHDYFVGFSEVLVHNGESDKKWTVYRREDDYVGKSNDFKRREGEWARKGHRIEPIHEGIPSDGASRGVEQVEIENNRKNGIGPKQNNSIDPNRTDAKAIQMRKEGAAYLKRKGC